MQILRIAQEAVNNVLKHAKAKNIWFDCNYDPVLAQLNLKIADDGVGLDPQSIAGRGKKNMMSRARTLDADLTLSNSYPGTLVHLRIPLR